MCTKLEKQTIELIARAQNDDFERCKVLARQLGAKLKLLNEIDGEILNICEVPDIQREIEESAEISDRILEAVRIIEKETKATEAKVSNTSINISIPSVNSEQSTEVETIEPNVENVQTSTSPNPDNGRVDGISDDSNNVTNNSTMSEQIASTPNVHLAVSLPKLPRLQLSKFSGKIT